MLVRRLAFAIGLLFALIGVQGPEFVQQYRQRLAGAIDELARVVAVFDADAARQSLTPEKAIARLERNPDPLARDRGEAAEADAARLVRLQAALAALKGDAPVWRLWTFVVDYDPEVAARTFADFEPAAPTTAEAFIVGALAALFGWGSTHLCAWPIRRRLARRDELAAQASATR